MSTEPRIKAIIVDDEPLAARRLHSMLEDIGSVDVVAVENDPLAALVTIEELNPDVLFLDIKMPGVDGFGLLERLKSPPPVVFTTAFDDHSLEAFDFLTIDYLLKPIEPKRLSSCIDKVEMFLKTSRNKSESDRKSTSKKSLRRVASKLGNRIRVIEVSRISHIYAEDKVTFASVPNERPHPLEQSLAQLEKALDPETFLRIHRATIVNLEHIDEVFGSFTGGMQIKLKDGSSVTVARSKVRALKQHLGA